MIQSTKAINTNDRIYFLSLEEWLEACNQLNDSETKVFFYLRTLNSSGTIQSVTATEIGKKLNLHKGTVSRALKSLKLKGWIDSEI